MYIYFFFDRHLGRSLGAEPDAASGILWINVVRVESYRLS